MTPDPNFDYIWEREKKGEVIDGEKGMAVFTLNGGNENADRKTIKTDFRD